MKLWLLRHAEVLAEAGICYGATDLEADPGRTHAAARRIAPGLGADLVVRSSPLRRCAKLAAAIGSERPEFVAALDSRLAEMNFGAWERRPWREIPREELDRWAREFATTPAGGHGESVRIFMARVAAAYDEWVASGSDALWITHAGVIRAVTLLARGVRCPTRADEWPKEGVSYGEWIVLEPR